MADLKYYDDTYAIKYSHAPNYFNIATTAIKEMVAHKLINVLGCNGKA